MRFGLTTPVVTLVPHRHAPWEESAGVDALRQVAQTADRLGFHHLTCSDHVAVPTEVAKVRGARYYDPFSTLGFFAAVTGQIRLVTHVLVLPYYHPLEVAKRLGTLDRLSGGRVIAGVGVGTLREEFALLGVDFERRGERYEDALRALRAALGRREPQYQGTHFAFDALIVDPAACQERLPIWLGGRTLRSLHRALRYADGWDPFGLSVENLEALVHSAQRLPEWREKKDFALVFAPEHPIDLSTPEALDGTVEQLRAYARLGTTHMNLQFRSQSLPHLLEQLAIFVERVQPHFA
ncbi:MAG: TIGR03619 family F420-dependent LLM class oxidoreductase [Deltaproteobacteria bacterium]|nr:TIGR03619 family F420-dependent LLM class oxidoreductase [Deltaproteobacteria bacterium]